MVKFDVVIGNPPYQDDNEGRNRADAIYPLFYDSSEKISDMYCLITPARFLFDTGATPSKWNKKMLSDEHLKVVYYNEDSSVAFTNTDIRGGIVVLIRNENNVYGKIGTFTRFSEMESVLSKVENSSFKPISEMLYNSTSYKFNPIMYEDYPRLKSVVTKSNRRTIVSNAFDRYHEVFSSKKNSTDIMIYGRQNNNRLYKYIDSKYIEHGGNLNGYKVLVTGANGTGEFGEPLSELEVGLPGMGHTQTFVSIGNFSSQEEANSLIKYLKGKFSRAMLSIKKVTHNGKTKETWSKVPLQDFTKDSDIDWTKSIAEIDQQLYAKYGLNEEEIAFIETHVKQMD